MVEVEGRTEAALKNILFKYQYKFIYDFKIRVKFIQNEITSYSRIKCIILFYSKYLIV